MKKWKPKFGAKNSDKNVSKENFDKLAKLKLALKLENQVKHVAIIAYFFKVLKFT